MCPCPDDEDTVTFEFSMDDFKDMAQDEEPGPAMPAPSLADIVGGDGANPMYLPPEAQGLIGQALVPYYRQILPVFNIFKNFSNKNAQFSGARRIS